MGVAETCIIRKLHSWGCGTL